MNAAIEVIVNAGSGNVLGDETARMLRERFIFFGIRANVHLATRVAIDGKAMIRRTPLEYRILPRALKVLVPDPVSIASHIGILRTKTASHRTRKEPFRTVGRVMDRLDGAASWAR